MAGLGGAEPGQGQGIQGGLGRGRERAEALRQVDVHVQECVREQCGLEVQQPAQLLSSSVRQDFMPCLLDSRVEPAGMWPPGTWACWTRRLSGGTAGGPVA